MRKQCHRCNKNGRRNDAKYLRKTFARDLSFFRRILTVNGKINRMWDDESDLLERVTIKIVGFVKINYKNMNYRLFRANDSVFPALEFETCIEIRFYVSMATIEVSKPLPSIKEISVDKNVSSRNELSY